MKKVFLKIAVIGLMTLSLWGLDQAVIFAQGNPIGSIEQTPGVSVYGPLSDGGSISGPVQFINVVLGVLAVIAGVALLFNIIMAAINIITGAGKPGKLMESLKRILLGIVGLVLIALAYVIVGFVSKTLFGSPDFILDPTIERP